MASALLINISPLTSFIMASDFDTTKQSPAERENLVFGQGKK
jgi:hypothetical protein